MLKHPQPLPPPEGGDPTPSRDVKIITKWCYITPIVFSKEDDDGVQFLNDDEYRKL